MTCEKNSTFLQHNWRVLYLTCWIKNLPNVQVEILQTRVFLVKWKKQNETNLTSPMAKNEWKKIFSQERDDNHIGTKQRKKKKWIAHSDQRLTAYSNISLVNTMLISLLFLYDKNPFTDTFSFLCRETQSLFQQTNG